MVERTELVEGLLEKGEQYGKTSLELLKLKTLDKSAELSSKVVSWLVVVIFAVLFFLILNIGVALWLGELLGRSYFGFFIVAGFYVLLALVCVLFRKKLIQKPLNNSIITHMLE